MDQASQAGYEALELGPDGYLPSNPDMLRHELCERGLRIAAGTACWSFDQFSGFKEFRSDLDVLCRRIKLFDGKYLVVMDESDVGQFSEKKGLFSASTWRHYLRMFKEIGEYTKAQYDIETVFHPHIKSLIETEEEIIRLLNETNLSLCFDTGHHAYVNGNGQQGDSSVRNFILAHQERIAYLHFKQVDGNVYQHVMEQHIDSDTAFDIGVMCDLQDGIIDFKDLKSVLDDINFNGIAVVESDMPKATNAQAFASAKRNLEYLRYLKIID